MLGRALAAFRRAMGADSAVTDARQGHKPVPADLTGRDLRGIDLRAYDLRGANLNGAILRGMDLRGVDLTGARMRGADLRDVICDETTVFDKADLSDLSYFEMRDMGLEDLPRQEFDERRKTRLAGGVFRGTSFHGGHAVDTCFDGADLRGAKITAVNVANATFKGALLQGTDLRSSYTCLFNGAGEVMPLLKADSAQLAEARCDATTLLGALPGYEGRHYTVKPDADGTLQAQIGPAHVVFGKGPGGTTF